MVSGVDTKTNTGNDKQVYIIIIISLEINFHHFVAKILTFVTGPGKTGFIYTKYTCSYHGTYFLFCMCYPKSVILLHSSLISAYMMTF